LVNEIDLRPYVQTILSWPKLLILGILFAGIALVFRYNNRRFFVIIINLIGAYPGELSLSKNFQQSQKILLTHDLELMLSWH
jgi:hypothetical protein